MYLEGTCIRVPKIVATHTGYDVYLDSSLGYEFQASFEGLGKTTRDEATEWAWEHAEDLWR